MVQPLLTVDRLSAYNRTDPSFLVFGRQSAPAVREVSLALAAGEGLALLGESGSGKSTLLRVLAGEQSADSGRVLLAGRDVTGRRDLGLGWLPQDPRLGLEPDRPLGSGAGKAPGDGFRARLARALADFGLNGEFLDRAPRAASGGQVQRMALARLLAANPGVLLLDEPVSGVDPHTAAQVVRVLRRLRDQGQVALLLATHDLRLAARLAHRGAVLLAGRVVEVAPMDVLLTGACHPHSRQLLGLAPEVPAPDPDLAAPAPPGCPLVGRCPVEQAACREVLPELRERRPGQWVRCEM